MKKIIALVICLISAFGVSLTSSNIECAFNDVWGFYVVRLRYECKVHNNPNILTKESAEISEINGIHKRSKGNNEVNSFDAGGKKIYFFPKGLTIFKNLKMIEIRFCGLKEIHQTDLKPFSNLVYLNLWDNEIEVIEEGLFDFNSKLQLVGFRESKLIHIDPNVFDHLTKLSHFLFFEVPCVGKKVEDSSEKLQEAIKVVKSNCSNSEFLSLDNKIRNLEIESRTMNSEDLKTKLETFEKSFNKSKFSKFRPLNYKFQNLKSANHTPQFQNVSVLNAKDVTLSNDLKNITDKLEDLNVSQCCLKCPVDVLKTLQNELQATLISIKSSVDDQGSKLDQTQNSQIQLKDNMSSSINNVINKVNEVTSSISQIEVKVNDLISSQTSSFNIAKHGVKLDKIEKFQSQFNANMSSTLNIKFAQIDQSQNSLKTSLESFKSSQESSLSKLTSKFNDLKNDIKSTQDDTRLSMNDIVVKLSDNKKFQIEVKDSFIKVRTMQNEMKMALNDLSVNKNDGFEDKLSDLSDKVNSLEGNFVDFKAEIVKNEKELTNKFHKMSTNFDEKIKGIEKRLMKKFEDILEEKLAKIFDEKLGN